MGEILVIPKSSPFFEIPSYLFCKKYKQELIYFFNSKSVMGFFTSEKPKPIDLENLECPKFNYKTTEELKNMSLEEREQYEKDLEEDSKAFAQFEKDLAQAKLEHEERNVENQKRFDEIEQRSRYDKIYQETLTEREQDSQNDKLDQITEKLDSLEKKIEVNPSEKQHEDKVIDTKTNYASPICYLDDDKVREILFSDETPVYHDRYSGKLFGGEYEKILITNKRIIFYKKTGTFSKKIKCETVPSSNLRIRSYEEKGTFSKKAILIVDIGMKEPLRWEGKPSDIQKLNRELGRI